MWIKVIDDNNKQCSTRDFPIFPPDVGSTSNTQFYTLFEDNLLTCAFTKFDAPKKLRYILETTTTELSEFDFCKSLLGSGAFKIQMEWNGKEYPTYASSLISVTDLIIDTSINEFDIWTNSLKFDVYLQ